MVGSFFRAKETHPLILIRTDEQKKQKKIESKPRFVGKPSIPQLTGGKSSNPIPLIAGWGFFLGAQHGEIGDRPRFDWVLILAR